MSATAEHLASLDSRVAEIRSAWDEEKRHLEQHIMTLETELAIRTKLHDEAILAKDRALRTTAKLLTQFGIVAMVFEEAKQMAMDAGLYTNPESLQSQTATVLANMDKINEIAKEAL